MVLDLLRASEHGSISSRAETEQLCIWSILFSEKMVLYILNRIISPCVKNKAVFGICSLPVGVVLREREGDVSARHQQEGTNKMNGTAAGQEDERVLEGHSILIK